MTESIPPMDDGKVAVAIGFMLLLMAGAVILPHPQGAPGASAAALIPKVIAIANTGLGALGNLGVAAAAPPPNLYWP